MPSFRVIFRQWFAKFSRLLQVKEALLFFVMSCLYVAPRLAKGERSLNAPNTPLANFGSLTPQSTIVMLPHPPSRQENLKIIITRPQEVGIYPLILWSHGVTSTPDVYPSLIDYWVSHGYIVIAPRHRDSREIPEDTRAYSFENWQERPQEVSFILDQLPIIGSIVPDLVNKIDLRHVAAGGYSFGGQMALLLAGAGQKENLDFKDNRIQAVIAISPAGPRDFFHPSSFTTIDTPLLVSAGTRDTAKYPDRLLGQGWRWHTSPYFFAKGGDKYLAVATLAQHDYDGIEKVSAGQESPYVQALQMLTLDFLNVYLKDDRAAKFALSPLPVFTTTCGIIRFFKR